MVIWIIYPPHRNRWWRGGGRGMPAGYCLVTPTWRSLRPFGGISCCPSSHHVWWVKAPWFTAQELAGLFSKSTQMYHQQKLARMESSNNFIVNYEICHTYHGFIMMPYYWVNLSSNSLWGRTLLGSRSVTSSADLLYDVVVTQQISNSEKYFINSFQHLCVINTGLQWINWYN